MPRKAANKLKPKKKREDVQEFSLAEAKVYFDVKEKTVIEVVTDAGRKTIDVKNIPEGPKASYEHVLNPEYLKSGPPYYICAKNFFHPEDGQIEEFFADVECKEHKIPGFSSGFNRNDHIFEINDVENLKKVLSLDAKQFNNRPVSIELCDINAERNRGQRQGYERGYQGREYGSGYSSNVMDRYKTMMGDDDRWSKEITGIKREEYGSRQPRNTTVLHEDWKAQKKQLIEAKTLEDDRRIAIYNAKSWNDNKKISERKPELSGQDESLKRLLVGDKWVTNPTQYGEGRRNNNDTQSRRRHDNGQHSLYMERYAEMDCKSQPRSTNQYMREKTHVNQHRREKRDVDESSEARKARYNSYGNEKNPKSESVNAQKWIKKPVQQIPMNVNPSLRVVENGVNGEWKRKTSVVPTKILENPNPPPKNDFFPKRSRLMQSNRDEFPRRVPQLPSKKHNPVKKFKVEKPTLVEDDDGFIGCNE